MPVNKVTTEPCSAMEGVQVSLLDLVLSIANAIDHVAPEVNHHHVRVAHTAVAIAREMQMQPHDLQSLLLACLLHDIGIFSLDERSQVHAFDSESVHRHAEAGYLLLKKYALFDSVATIVRFHHESWSKCSAQCRCNGGAQGDAIPLASHILHLADRINVLISSESGAHTHQIASINDAISRESGGRFAPDAVSAFLKVSAEEQFWQDLNSSQIVDVLRASARDMLTTIDWTSFQGFAELMAQVIDFRCRFTSTHSSGVAAVAAKLASLADFSQLECEKIKVAGYLHDIGKLAIPKEILEKSERLSREEYLQIQEHVHHTRSMLQHISGLEDVVTWAADHHERLDGTGYPGNLQANELSLGSRIIAVADLFTALSEDRPYRLSRDQHEVTAIMRQQADNKLLDERLVVLALSDYTAMNMCRRHAQSAAVDGYESFRKSLGMTESEMVVIHSDSEQEPVVTL